MFDISAIIILHREGGLALPALSSMKELVLSARATGLSVEALAVLDNADDLTRRMVATRGAWLDATQEASFGDLGLSRNKGVQSAQGEYVAFLDGDDLWGADWLHLAHAAATAPAEADDAIWHPECLFFFNEADFDRQSVSRVPSPEAQSFFFFHHTGVDSDLVLNTLFMENMWSANVFARRSLYLRFPYRSVDKEKGVGIEDWSWNLETVWAGVPHRVVTDTVHLIRLKDVGSLNQQNASQGLLPYLPGHAWPKLGFFASSCRQLDV